METLWNDFVAYTQAGFAQVNVVQGLIIAVIAAFMTARWSNVFVVSIGAVVIHILIDALLPAFNSTGAFRLPPVVEGDYWRYLLALYLGYVVAITIFYVVKRVFMSAQHGHA